MTRTVRWRLHTSSPPDKIYRFWTTDDGRERFWAEQSRSQDKSIALTFPDGAKEECRVLETQPQALFRFTYFGSEVTVQLDDDGHGGTDLTLTNRGVPEPEYEEVHAGWLNVLLPLKAAADFEVDLRNHDRSRTWKDGYVDQ